MQVIVRHGTPDDCQAICQLLADVHTIHNGALPEVFGPSDGTSMFRDRVTELIDGEDSVVLVAELGGRVSGAASVVIREVADRMMMVPRRYGWVETVGVSEEARRRGVGKALMDAAVQWVRRKGGDTCELNVWEFNDGAVEFYRSLGFTTASRRMWKRLR